VNSTEIYAESKTCHTLHVSIGRMGGASQILARQLAKIMG